ncbi:spore cortex biosynthesis protein YabQ [Anaerofustis stercorihominis]|uniref:Spore cortex biosynthesis protein YabQ n=2 Tax=Anaerofustis stercorihominis TaxID=214853 RepID=B1C9F2_9FIRM|nr:spore cortex biosynthesis protein YabQ [Anaerofustis stercorihominis]EDS72523.1 putative spore cortex biosynthesis protein YabQ [Anaerofustis stercorihominis DSM 17244]RGD73539.1 hypothetical protein DW687_09270 [Anaerofustis stercorihominis]
MNNNLYSQYLVLLETFYGGCILGILYHTITIIIYALTKRVTLSDLCFCLVAGVFTVNLFFKTTYFDLRYYSVLSFVLGFTAYYFLISPFYKSLLLFITRKLGLIKTNTKKGIVKRKRKFVKKHQKSIGKIKSLLKRFLSIPLKIKMSYNKFKVYLKKEGIDNEKRGLRTFKSPRQHRSEKKKEKKIKKESR